MKIYFSVRSATALPDVIILARFFPFRYHKLLVECNDNISPYSSSIFPAHASCFIVWIYDEFLLFWSVCVLNLEHLFHIAFHSVFLSIYLCVWSRKYTWAVFHSVFEYIQDVIGVIWETCSVSQRYRVGIVTFTKLRLQIKHRLWIQALFVWSYVEM